MHIYPVRHTRNYWKIPLYSCHECNYTCRHKLLINAQGQLEIVSNPEYDTVLQTCDKHQSICTATVPIYSFDFQHPSSLEGQVYYPDLVVIPDTEFSIHLHFPFSTVVETCIQTPEPVTLRELLYLIKHMYTQIYEDEEKTADATTYEYFQPCACVNEDIHAKIQRFEYHHPILGDCTCSVCLLDMNTETENIRLSCHHFFHKQCIVEWCEKGQGNRCPLCRKAISDCVVCDNERQVRTREDYVVIPLHLRQDTSERNRTNGIYGIYEHDLENLYITEMHYNRVMKYLHVSVQV